MFKIVSGGQTGVDRGALDAALAAGIPCGGWCPPDCRAEDGIINPRYPLTPLPDGGYRKRTRQNVIDSDATVIIYQTEIVLGGGTELTLKTCIARRKPYLLIDASVMPPETAGAHIADFVQRHHIETLNFAGPRGSGAPGIGRYTEEAVLAAIRSFQAA